MFTLRFAILAGSALAIATTTAGAQGRRMGIPPGQMPPDGLCRVWIDGVPPGRQPRPTDCANARAHAPANSHVIYGNQSQGRVSLNPRAGTVNGRYDSRADPRSPSYDPRYDSNSRLYDPRNGNYSNSGSRYNDRDGEKLERKSEREREKTERKNDKRWDKDKKHDGEYRAGDDR